MLYGDELLIILLLGLLSGPIAIFLIRRLPQYIELQEKFPAKPLKITYTPNRFIDKYISHITCVTSIAIPLVISHGFMFNMHSYLLMFFCWVVLVLIAIDFCTLYLPDMLTLPMIWLGLIKEFFVATQFIGMNQAVLGAVVSYISLRGLSELYYLVTKKEALGRGDIKFFAMIGAWLGLGAVYFTIMLSSILVCVFYGLKYFLLKKKHLKKFFPYGPWIGLSLYLYLLLNH